MRLFVSKKVSWGDLLLELGQLGWHLIMHEYLLKARNVYNDYEVVGWVVDS